MMNKAEKREIEVVTLRSIYNTINYNIGGHQNEIEKYEGYIKANLEENPDYDCSYYLDEIEKSKTFIDTYKKVQEMVYKMM